MVMKSLKRYSIVFGTVFLLAGFLPAARAAGKKHPQTACPVSGAPIQKDIYTDYDGRRIYFCCKGCIDAFKQDPERYVKKMEAEGVVLEKAPVPQTTCPVSGKKIDRTVYTDYNGKRIYFCCPDCIAAFKKSPEKYVKKMEGEGITLEDTPK
jgi:YHS domain-containing protein